MKLINLTPHDITLVNRENNEITLVIPASGVIARLKSETVVTGQVTIDGFDVELTETRYGKIENLPDPEDGVIYITSSLVAGQCPDRSDVRIPNESVRNDKGQIIGCYSLGRV